MRRLALPLLVVGVLLVGAFYSARRAHVAPQARPQSSSTKSVEQPPAAAAHPTAEVESGCFGSIPASGQKTSYGTDSDGDLQSGGKREFFDQGNGTILDVNTGLVWEKKALYENVDVNCTAVETCPNPHDADNRYLWTLSESAMDGPIVTVFLEQLNHRCERDTRISCQDDSDCTAAGGHCGFTGQRDWRIPNWKELLTIVDFDAIGPSVGKAFNDGCSEACNGIDCSCTVPNVYWTSSTSLEDPTSGGYVGFYDGNVHADTKNHAFFVRAVRGGMQSPDSSCDRFFPQSGQTISYGPHSDGAVLAGGTLRYRDNGDGTLTDQNTGLMWEKKAAYANNTVNCDSSQDCPNPHDGDNRYSWGSGESLDGSVVSLFLEQLNHRCDRDTTITCQQDADCAATAGPCGFAGHRDWRLPQVKELHSIVHYGQLVPSVSEAFTAGCTETCDVKSCSCTARGHHWTGTTYQGDPSWAVFVGFFDGNVFAEEKSKYRHVRAVRAGY